MIRSVSAWGITLPREPHPKFPFPTISEVICEIGFRREEADRISATTLLETLRPEYPEIQPVGAVAVQVAIGQTFVTPPPGFAQVPSPSFKFASATGDQFVQVSGSNFIYHSARAYPGWDAAKAAILWAWTQVLPRLKPTELTKMGLRYVNKIAKDEPHPHLSDWLRPTDDLPRRLIASKGHFLARVESTSGPTELRLVTLAQLVPDATAPHGAILFDIDRITTERRPATETAIAETLQTLHDDVWDIFSPARTPTLDAKLQGD
jgi:uncharacterized protein (TIGR04255 family)